MNADGSNQMQLTTKDGGFPLFPSHLMVAWLYYSHGLHRTLWRVSADGGDEQLVLDKAKSRFAFSPDGSLVAFKEWQAKEQLIIVMSIGSGRPVPP